MSRPETIKRGPAVSNAQRFEVIPAELKALRHWVAWDRRTRKGESKPTKLPIDPKNGRPAKANDPATWASFEEAVRAAGKHSGIGFVFTADDPFCGIDLDAGADSAWIERFGSYTERSQSGNGYHIIVRAVLPDGRGRKRGPYEVYDRLRYFVMTGAVVRNQAIAERQEVVAEFLGECFPEKAAVLPAARAQVDRPSQTGVDLLDEIRRSPQGPKFDRLFSGQWENEYSSHSEADAALLGILRFWTGGDQAASFRLFELSALCRPKWRNRPDYRERTWALVEQGETRDQRRPAGIVEFSPSPAMEAAKEAPSVRSLADFAVPPDRDDPDEILRHRFLCRGGGGLLCGPSGVGKSSFAIQAALCWSLGQPFLGLQPARAFATLIVQAENDDGDVAEIREGALDGLRLEGVAERDLLQATSRVHVASQLEAAGFLFGPRLERLLDECSPIDLLIIDPAFAYLGGDASDAKAVSVFLRQTMNPILRRRNIAAIIVHHGAKPTRAADRVAWQGSDHAYLAHGSAEWTNWARCVVNLENIGRNHIFRLRAAKRGRRLGWTAEDGSPILVKFIRQDPERICWHEATAEETATARADGRRSARTAKRVAENYREEGVQETLKLQQWKIGELKTHFRKKFRLGDTEARRLLKLVAEDERIQRWRENRGIHPIHLIGPVSHLAAKTESVETERKKN